MYKHTCSFTPPSAHCTMYNVQCTGDRRSMLIRLMTVSCGHHVVQVRGRGHLIK